MNPSLRGIRTLHIAQYSLPKLSNICSYGFFFQGTQELVQNTVINEPSVFQPLEFYCIMIRMSYVTGDEPSTSVEKEHLPDHLLHQYRDPLQVNPEVSQCDGWMDDLRFYVLFLTVFQSYQDDVWMIKAVRN